MSGDLKWTVLLHWKWKRQKEICQKYSERDTRKLKSVMEHKMCKKSKSFQKEIWKRKKCRRDERWLNSLLK